ncbi:hypothetical protein J008_01746 [Cryptococcus neoformans]|nr:hypothetical protein J008_01746 [Cryptococcus neoformans var. grubii]
MESSHGFGESYRPVLKLSSVAFCANYENDSGMAKGEKVLANVDDNTESSSELTPTALQSIQLLPAHNLSFPHSSSVASDTLYSAKSESSFFDPPQFPQPPTRASLDTTTPSSTHQSPAPAKSRSQHRSRVSLDATPLTTAAELHRPSSPKLAEEDNEAERVSVLTSSPSTIATFHIARAVRAPLTTHGDAFLPETSQGKQEALNRHDISENVKHDIPLAEEVLRSIPGINGLDEERIGEPRPNGRKSYLDKRRKTIDSPDPLNLWHSGSGDRDDPTRRTVTASTLKQAWNRSVRSLAGDCASFSLDKRSDKSDEKTASSTGMPTSSLANPPLLPTVGPKPRAISPIGFPTPATSDHSMLSVQSEVHLLPKTSIPHSLRSGQPWTSLPSFPTSSPPRSFSAQGYKSSQAGIPSFARSESDLLLPLPQRQGPRPPWRPQSIVSAGQRHSHSIPEIGESKTSTPPLLQRSRSPSFISTPSPNALQLLKHSSSMDDSQAVSPLLETPLVRIEAFGQEVATRDKRTKENTAKGLPNKDGSELGRIEESSEKENPRNKKESKGSGHKKSFFTKVKALVYRPRESSAEDQESTTPLQKQFLGRKLSMKRSSPFRLSSKLQVRIVPPSVPPVHPIDNLAGEMIDPIVAAGAQTPTTKRLFRRSTLLRRNRPRSPSNLTLSSLARYSSADLSLDVHLEGEELGLDDILDKQKRETIVHELYPRLAMSVDDLTLLSKLPRSSSEPMSLRVGGWKPSHQKSASESMPQFKSVSFDRPLASLKPPPTILEQPSLSAESHDPVPSHSIATPGFQGSKKLTWSSAEGLTIVEEYSDLGEVINAVKA